MEEKPIHAQELLQEKTKLHNLLEHLKKNPTEISKTVSNLLYTSQKDEEDIDEEDESLDDSSPIDDALTVCLMIICGTEDTEGYFKELVAKGIIKTNVCGNIWKDGGQLSSFQVN